MSKLEKYEPMAKLALEGEERAWAEKIIERLEGEFDAFDAIDTEGVAPMVTVLELTSVLREDVSEQVVSRQTLLENAPAEYDGYFEVPRTIE